MPDAVTTSPGTAISERAALESQLVSVSLRAMRVFLAGVEQDAVVALSSPVVLAAATELPELFEEFPEPFTLGKVHRRWKTMAERILAEFAHWLPHSYLTAVETRLTRYPLPGQTYTSVRSVLAAATSERWARDRTLKQLSRVLDPSTGTTLSPGPADPEGINWADQARRIARTEATAAYGWVSVRRMAGDPDTTQKRWVAVGDKHTRKTHAAASGQTVAVSEPFLVGNSVLHYPGDPSGSTGETANCRCAVVAVRSSE